MIRPLAALAFAAGLLPLASAWAADLPPDPGSIITIQGENASISGGSPTDRLYTNGMLIGWTSPTGAVPGVLSSLGQSLWGSGLQRMSVDVSHQIYTPINTAARVAKAANLKPE